MTKRTITRTHEISCGHRVLGHEGKCSHLHGHNYKFEITVGAKVLDEIGRIIDFSVIKNILCEWLEENWDHRMLIYIQDPLARELKRMDGSVVYVEFNPTVENMAEYFFFVGDKLLAGTHVKMQKLTIWETSKCSATYENFEQDIANA